MFKLHLKKQKTVLYSIFKKPLSDIKSAISSCEHTGSKHENHLPRENVASATWVAAVSACHNKPSQATGCSLEWTGNVAYL